MRVVHGLVRHEARLFVSLGLWLARRTHGTAGGRAFGYARGQGSTLFGLGFVCVVESFTMSVLLRDWPTAHRVVLLLDVYTLLFVVGLHAACVVRPHVLTPDALRVRYGAHVDLRIPLAVIGAVRRETRTTHERAAGELDLPIASRTTLTLELTVPVTRTTLFGRRRTASVVRLHAEDPDDLVRALTRVRTGSSTCPDPLG